MFYVQAFIYLQVISMVSLFSKKCCLASPDFLFKRHFNRLYYYFCVISSRACVICKNIWIHSKSTICLCVFLTICQFTAGLASTFNNVLLTMYSIANAHFSLNTDTVDSFFGPETPKIFNIDRSCFNSLSWLALEVFKDFSGVWRPRLGCCAF